MKDKTPNLLRLESTSLAAKDLFYMSHSPPDVT